MYFSEHSLFFIFRPITDSFKTVSILYIIHLSTTKQIFIPRNLFYIQNIPILYSVIRFYKIGMRGAEFMSQQENLYESSRIGENVVNLRESKNYSQAYLAKLMNLNKNVLGRIERGERPLRDTEILKLAEIFHVSTDLILDNQTEVITKVQEDFSDYRNKSQKDIAKQMSKFLDFLKKEPNLTFSGKVLSSEERKNITTAFEVTNRLIIEQLSRK